MRPGTGDGGRGTGDGGRGERASWNVGTVPRGTVEKRPKWPSWSGSPPLLGVSAEKRARDSSPPQRELDVEQTHAPNNHSQVRRDRPTELRLLIPAADLPAGTEKDGPDQQPYHR